MAYGGARQGAGRKKGQATKMNEKARQKAADGGLMPLDYLLSIMRDEGQPQDERKDAARAAAPYVHARLQSIEVEHSGEINRVTDKPQSEAEWQEQYTAKE